MSRGSGIYNLITIIFLVLSLVACGIVLWLMLQAPVAQVDVGVIPTAIVLPTLTPSATATNTPLPTFTSTATQTLIPSITPVPTNTPTLTLTPTVTLTLAPTITITNTPGPTPTATATFTPTNTDVPTAAPSPTGPTPSPYPFALSDAQPNFTVNFANTAGCAWQGIGGQVYDVNGNPLTNIRVHVFGQNFDQYTSSGTNSLYGVSGWEISVGTTISASTFVVELLSAQGTLISPSITVAFPGDCSRNLALVNFSQTRPF